MVIRLGDEVDGREDSIKNMVAMFRENAVQARSWPAGSVIS